MIRKKISINIDGAMTRSYVAELVQRAGKFESRIMLEWGNRIVNVKSTLGLLSLTAEARKDITLLVEGSDEEAAVESILQTKGISAE